LPAPPQIATDNVGEAKEIGVVQKWPVLGNTDNKNPAARQGWF
jgi:hypothetical protein